MAKKETMDAIENTLDSVEDTLETLERIPRVNLNGTTRQQQIIILTSVAVVSSAVTALVSYAIVKGKIRLRRKQDADAAVVI